MPKQMEKLTLTQLTFICSKSTVETEKNEIFSKLTIKTPERTYFTPIF